MQGIFTGSASLQASRENNLDDVKQHILLNKDAMQVLADQINKLETTLFGYSNAPLVAASSETKNNGQNGFIERAMAELSETNVDITACQKALRRILGE